MRKYQVIVTDVTEGEPLAVMDYIIAVKSGRIADALRFGTLEGAQELDANGGIYVEGEDSEDSRASQR